MDFGFNLGVLAFALGIGAYYGLPFEPNLILIVSMSFGLLSLYLILRRKGNFLANIIAYCLIVGIGLCRACLLYTSPSPRDKRQSRMPSSA